MSNPWIKFYPRDWRGDQSLRAVSIAARGLWMECLCIMHEAKPYGHLLLNGEPVEDATLARMTGVPVDEVSALMAELRQAGVLGLTGKGVIFSRRMTKDHARASKGQKAAKKRWAQDTEKTVLFNAPNGSPSSTPITQKPEARKKVRDKSLTGGCAAETVEAIWQKLPLKKRNATSKAKLLKPVGRLLKAGHTSELIITAASRCYSLPQNTKEDGQYAPAVYTWLADGVWENFASGGTAQVQALTDEQWTAVFRLYCETGTWPPHAGPQPDHDGCRAPSDLLAKYFDWVETRKLRGAAA